MYIVAGAMGLFYITLAVLSRKESVEERSAVTKIFFRMSVYLYKKSCVYRIPLFSSARVAEDLAKLYPGKAKEGICTDYYIKKLARSLMVCFVGSFLAVAVGIQAENARVIKDGATIERNSYREGAVDIQVECVESNGKAANKKDTFLIRVEPQTLAEDEIQNLYEMFVDELDRRIQGKNPSLEEVSTDLNLEEAYEGFPFLVTWESENPGVLYSDGTVLPPEEGTEEVGLTAVISYNDWSREAKKTIRVVPRTLSEEEQRRKELENLLLVEEEANREEKLWVLPQSFQGEQLSWKESISQNDLLLWMGAVVVSVVIYLLEDRDLHELLKKKRKQMKQEYPDIVHTLSLYLGAGMSIRGAFQRIAGDYEKERKKGKRESPIREELLFACRELQAGASEGAVYERFGKRTGLQEYIRLSTLLTQNLKKGSSTLLQRLGEETQKASAERLQYGRRLGEEAVTKLLLPMILLLLVVMLMIMIPAFSSVGTY